ncbi:hypothetical protein JD79_04246 [Geodermatophilus normandii]|uniref:Uncharacterized protein n=1 Tax=Geodermatophilus normandii TaxID=1137989 RepID=A0A317QNW3_9ACTN|nr:hypothetical protein JD79_04246 [Geodermatophilus normandii]
MPREAVLRERRGVRADVVGLRLVDGEPEEPVDAEVVPRADGVGDLEHLPLGGQRRRVDGRGPLAPPQPAGVVVHRRGAGDEEAAVAAARAGGHLGPVEHDHREAGVDEAPGGRQATDAGTDHADVRPRLALQRRSRAVGLVLPQRHRCAGHVRPPLDGLLAAERPTVARRGAGPGNAVVPDAPVRATTVHGRRPGPLRRVVHRGAEGAGRTAGRRGRGRLGRGPRRRRAGGGRLGRVRRRGGHDPVAAGHDHRRPVGDQDDDGAVRAGTRRPRRPRPGRTGRPESTVRGEERVLVRRLLAHGGPPDRDGPVEDLHDWTAATTRLAPQGEPGTAAGTTRSPGGSSWARSSADHGPDVSP